MTHTARPIRTVVRGSILAATALATTVLPYGTATAAPTQYAAIAVTTSEWSWHSVWGRPNAQAAVDDAVRLCNQNNPAVHHPGSGSSGGYTTGGDCKWKVWAGPGECIALVESYNTETGKRYFSWGKGATRWEADFNAIQQGTGYRSHIETSLCQ